MNRFPFALLPLLAVFPLLGCPATTPVDTASCSSGQLYNGSTGEGDAVDNADTSPILDESGDGDATMNPGQDCIVCHATNEATDFTVAGTVMGASHDVDDCIGTSGVTVTVTDADGVVTTLTTNSSGNFSSSVTFAPPYNASVTMGGVTSSMSAAQTDGDCASCHTKDGVNGAPGRIVSP
jgi:mono/diheme cytochrome c family protein